MKFSRDVLLIDPAEKAQALGAALHEVVHKRFRRRGVVVAVSGGIDSACVAALAAKALGPDRVHALLLPERDSSPESLALGHELCEKLGIDHEVEPITPVLEAAGCYRRQVDALRAAWPDYQGEKFKIAVSGSPLAGQGLHFFHAVFQLRGGGEHRVRLTSQAYLELVAATNFKQRVRKMFEYHRADRLAYAVAGTPNRLEYDQGFFVKLGDGAADVKPIASLYKTQVYALARHLGVPDGILRREPTTDTYSLQQSQEEFYFAVPWRDLDLLLYAYDHQVAAADVAPALGWTPEQVERGFKDIEQKRRSTLYMHEQGVLLEPVPWPPA